jgi:hypothetical protein
MTHNKYIMTLLTKTISLRISMDEYYKILSECESKSITVTEWIERQLALAIKYKTSKSLLIDYILEIETEFKAVLDMDLKLKLLSIKRGVRDF